MERKVFHYGDGSVKRVESRKSVRKREELENRAEYWEQERTAAE